jgi:hypothetical protein
MPVTEKDGIATGGDVAVGFSFFDTDVLDLISLGDHVHEPLSCWPQPSPRATTPATASALEAATTPDPEPYLPETDIDDGFGI